jgi:AcrR family transcriptional regulator
MAIPYESTGRTRQKQRTRDALLAAAQALLAAGETPTVEQAADAAGISRTTAYRYFASQRSLLLAAIPVIDRDTLLGPGAPADVAARLDLVIAGQTEILRDWEPQLRAALRLSLDPVSLDTVSLDTVSLDTVPPAGSPLRAGRAIGWIADALGPLVQSHPRVDRRRLAIAIRATCGIESLVWLTDVAGLSRDDAAALMRSSAQALLAAALAADAS